MSLSCTLHCDVRATRQHEVLGSCKSSASDACPELQTHECTDYQVVKRRSAARRHAYLELGHERAAALLGLLGRHEREHAGVRSALLLVRQRPVPPRAAHRGAGSQVVPVLDYLHVVMCGVWTVSWHTAHSVRYRVMPSDRARNLNTEAGRKLGGNCMIAGST